MRKVLSSSSEVFHFWANKAQSEGRAGNVFFEGDYVYSYGKHFVIARHLPGGAVVFATRGYSSSTASHVSGARSAASHLRIVYCSDPARSAMSNMHHARAEIRNALDASERPRIHQATRDAHRARALRIAINANEYLAALPESERSGQEPIDTATLEAVRQGMIEVETAAERIRAEQAAARAADLSDSLAGWRAHRLVARTGLISIPPALRLSLDRAEIQTSHGASIPASFASRLWRSICEARRSAAAYKPSVAPMVGVYRLNRINADGSIVVGCHQIDFTEIEGIALELGFIQAATAS
jgi:hypothetical protein